jgi:L-fuconolactonase
LTIDASAEMLFATLAQHGVDNAVVVQPRAYGDDHTYLLSALARFRDRMVAVAALDPRDDGAPAALTHLVDHGIKGLRLDPLGWGTAPLVDGTVLPLWDQAVRSGIAIELMIRPDQLSALGALAARTTDPQVVVEHAARYGADPHEPLDSLLELEGLPNVTVKLSALSSISTEPPPHRDLWPILERLVGVFGPERLMWGSDMPWIGAEAYRSELETVASLPFVDENGRTWLLGRTAARVFALT